MKPEIRVGESFFVGMATDVQRFHSSFYGKHHKGIHRLGRRMPFS